MSQQMEALEIANRVRFGGIHVRQEVTAGLITVAEALEDPRAGSMPIGRLLCAQRAWGPTKAHRLLNGLSIWPTRKVRELTERQKRLIAEALRGA
jgi:hypothetical protein